MSEEKRQPTQEELMNQYMQFVVAEETQKFLSESREVVLERVRKRIEAERAKAADEQT